jgi:hypothetical protein
MMAPRLLVVTQMATSVEDGLVSGTEAWPNISLLPWGRRLENPRVLRSKV